MENLKKISSVFIIPLIFIAFSCNSRQNPETAEIEIENKEIKYKVTFIELGSVKCIHFQQIPMHTLLLLMLN